MKGKRTLSEGKLRRIVSDVTRRALREEALREDMGGSGQSQEIINKFIMFSFNYDSSLRWIHRIFDEEGLGDHLVNKFRDIQESYGYAGAMNIFWTEIDQRCQAMLTDYIMNEYRG